jgi:hypothetical protein
MDNLSPESELVRGLITITTDCEDKEEEKISNVIQQAILTLSINGRLDIG